MTAFIALLGAPRAWRVLLAMLLLLVSYLALTPSPQNGPDLGWDKLNHVAAFVALGFAAWLSFTHSQRAQRLVLLALLAYGGAIELLQLYVPGRSCEWSDMLADVVGISLGAGVAACSLYAARKYKDKYAGIPRR